MAFAWFVWDRAHRGDATVRRISWERPEPLPAVLGKRGRPRKGEGKGAVSTLKRGSTSRAYILARLERDGHAEFVAQVRAGRLSARAAAAAAGFGASLAVTNADPRET